MALPPTANFQTLPNETQIDGDSVHAFDSSLKDDAYKRQIIDKQMNANLGSKLFAAHLNDLNPVYEDDLSNQFCEQLNDFESKYNDDVHHTSDDGLSGDDDGNAHYPLGDDSASEVSTFASPQNSDRPFKPNNENNLFSAEKIAPFISNIIEEREINDISKLCTFEESKFVSQIVNKGMTQEDVASLDKHFSANDNFSMEDEELETINLPLSGSLVDVTDQFENGVSKSQICFTRKTGELLSDENKPVLYEAVVIKDLCGHVDPNGNSTNEKVQLAVSFCDLNESCDSNYIMIIPEADLVKPDILPGGDTVTLESDCVTGEKGDESMSKERLIVGGSSDENQSIDIISGQSQPVTVLEFTSMLEIQEFKPSDYSITDYGKISIICEEENEENVVKFPSDLPLSIPHLDEMEVCQGFAKEVDLSRVKDSFGIFERENKDADTCVQDSGSYTAEHDGEDEICTLQQPETSSEKEQTSDAVVDNLVRHEEVAKGKKKQEKEKKVEGKNELGKATGKKGKKKKGKKSAKRDISKSGSCSPPCVPHNDVVQRRILRRGQQWSIKKADNAQLSIVNESGLSDNANDIQSESQLRGSHFLSHSQDLPVKSELLLKTEAEPSFNNDEECLNTIDNKVISTPLSLATCKQSNEGDSANTFQISIEDLVQEIINVAIARSVEKDDSNNDIERKSIENNSYDREPITNDEEAVESNKSLLRSNSRKLTGRSDSFLLTDLVNDGNPDTKENGVISFDATLSIVTPSLPVVEYLLDDSSSSSSRRSSSCSHYSGDHSDCSNSVILAKSWSKQEYVSRAVDDNACEDYEDGTFSTLRDKETVNSEELKEKSSNSEDLELGYVSDDSSVALASEERPSKANENLADDSEDLDNLKNKSIKEQIERILGERLQTKESVAASKKIPAEESRDDKVEDALKINMKESKAPGCKGGRPRKHKNVGIKGAHNRHITPLATRKEGEIGDNKGGDEFDRPSNTWNLTFLSEEENCSSELNSSSKDECSEDDVSKCIIHRWTVLESKAMDRQRQSSQLRQLQRQMKNLRLNLESISDRCSSLAHPHSMALPSQLKQKVEEAKNLLEETEKLKSDMSNLNLVIHRFVVDVGPSVSSLKEDVTELYRVFDETQRRVIAEITRLESAEATWRLWEEQKQQLMDALKQDKETLKILDTAIDTGRVSESITASIQDVAKLLNQKRRTLDDRGDFESSLLSNTQISITDVLDATKQSLQMTPAVNVEESREDHLSDSGTSGYESCSSDDLSERERRLAYLRRLARDLEANLAPGSKAWSEICLSLSQAEKELRGLQSHCQNLILKTAENLDKGSLKPAFAQNSNKRRNWPREKQKVLRPDKKRNGRSNRGWIGRVARAALPFQVALLLLFCVACLLEPNCCDSVNTLNLSFSPQLRYVHGAPPT